MKRAILIASLLALAVGLGGCVTGKHFDRAIDSHRAMNDDYLAATAAINDAAKVHLECDSPCSLTMPGVPSASPERPTSDVPAVSAAYQAQMSAGASVGVAAVGEYVGLKKTREQGATSRYIAEQNRISEESRTAAIGDALAAQQQMLTDILDRVIPEVPEEPEPEPEPEPEEEVIE